ncbi:type II secretory pathway pseudopilin PulG/nucleotide-binding universal stress UspA family protein [Actinomadura coerulea]|uniref:Type II secretory pathway pseudopilin PulG/nucleotide-binding universal stress UspA family protein n=1 Tax=Actinomadura coerulea TaxID=46159 RepID=A0A7X0L082_9ACTN|nr:hypothetical protein [Actinomadura coerulea]MBB6397215.1 type II secretory pathway pseudopilin PulG/nucleotide-binding universal stress UspA family protein [Actinomadura coerulea]GGQ43957.1 hypothetical protein GCM10010187_73100 [Actinomadura coerulea]
MTAKTTKGGSDEVEAVPAEEAPERTEAAEPEAAERAARPAARRKRRVRVIEVIDDEDLDEVLEALDAEDEEAPDEAPARPAGAAAKPAAKPAAKAPAKPKPRPARLEPPEDEVEEEAEEEAETPKKAPARPSAAASSPDRPGIFGLGMVQAVVVVVLVALLASLAIWQWTSASSLSSEQDERDAVSKVASAYGDVALNYNAQNYQTQMDKAQKLMGGDLLESFKSTTLPSLGATFKNNPELSLTSKTNQVFVGSVDGRFATAVVMVDIDVRTKDGSTAAPATLLRLALAKIDGKWKVTRQYASGVNDQNQNQQNQLPAVPGGGASKSPAAEKTGKPKN